MIRFCTIIRPEIDLLICQKPIQWMHCWLMTFSPAYINTKHVYAYLRSAFSVCSAGGAHSPDSSAGLAAVWVVSLSTNTISIIIAIHTVNALLAFGIFTSDSTCTRTTNTWHLSHEAWSVSGKKSITRSRTEYLSSFQALDVCVKQVLEKRNFKQTWTRF